LRVPIVYSFLHPCIPYSNRPKENRI
jgi:hypothetical protein